MQVGDGGRGGDTRRQAGTSQLQEVLAESGLYSEGNKGPLKS